MLQLKFSLEEDGFNVNSMKWSGWTLLHRAAELGRDDIINILIDYGADPNIYSTWGWQTPLHMALGKDE
jgi:ankyrin repeat protein